MNEACTFRAMGVFSDSSRTTSGVSFLRSRKTGAGSGSTSTLSLNSVRSRWSATAFLTWKSVRPYDTNAFPPHVLLVRGTAAIDIVDGVPPEYLAASRKGVGPDQWDAFEAQVRAMYKQMARIKITPLWAKLLDFQTRFPTPIEKLIRRVT